MLPPVCLKTHWDPTESIRRILPQQRVALPQDPRPWVRVCKKYVTSGPVEEMAPLPPSSMVFPSGGQFYPPGRYTARIDDESVLRTLDQPLDKWCPTTQYVPDESSTLYVAGGTVPDRQPISSAFIQELAMPRALLRDAGEVSCRSQNDALYFQRSGRLFNNPTKQDRYGADKYYALPDRQHEKGEPMAHGGVPLPVTVTGQAGRGRWSISQPGGGGGSSGGGKRMLQTKGAHTSAVGVTTAGLAAPVW